MKNWPWEEEEEEEEKGGMNPKLADFRRVGGDNKDFFFNF